jgi:hypothetical protein
VIPSTHHAWERDLTSPFSFPHALTNDESKFLALRSSQVRTGLGLGGVGKDRRGDLVTIPIDASYLSDLTTGEERE